MVFICTVMYTIVLHSYIHKISDEWDIYRSSSSENLMEKKHFVYIKKTDIYLIYLYLYAIDHSFFLCF